MTLTDKEITEKAKKEFHSLSSIKSIPERTEEARQQWIQAYCTGYNECLEDNKTYILIGRSHDWKEKEIDECRIMYRTLIHLTGETFDNGTILEGSTGIEYSVKQYTSFLKKRIEEFDKKYLESSKT